MFKTLTIPANTIPGSYRIIAKADNANTIAETNENNNVASFGITVLATADLVPTTVSAPTSISAGNPMSLICQIKNQGLTTANATQVHYFLYDQSLLNFIELGYTAINPLAVNTSNVKYPTFTVPVNTPPGTYQLYFVADGGGAIQELNEQNNASTRSITITAPRPDLTVFSASVPSTTTAGSTLTGSTCQVKNIGSATANSSLLRIYLSNNNTYSSNDILLSSSTIGTTTPNGSYYRYPTLNIPNAISGSYYLLFQADANNQVTESNENNNITVRPITINPSSSRFANTGSITLTAYPNPTTDVLNLTWKATQNQKSLLTIYNANGQTVMQKDINTLQGSNTYTINMLNLPAGVYVVIVDDMVVRVVKN
ncbi:MAG: T9SS type A sorting domain-containing protein [Sphingobacteriales bacterium]|nr:T9SS type A sorting domain-containing protein [Sphingobacteriales bacterium]